MQDKIPYPEELLNGPRDPKLESCPGCGEAVHPDSINYEEENCESCAEIPVFTFNFKANEDRVMQLPEMQRALFICSVCRYRIMEKTENPCFSCRVINERK